jgi:hypothetical protein
MLADPAERLGRSYDRIAHIRDVRGNLVNYRVRPEADVRPLEKKNEAKAVRLGEHR